MSQWEQVSEQFARLSLAADEAPVGMERVRAHEMALRLAQSNQSFAEEFVARVDRVHLTIDLDALPASVAPGVSAPAGFGISLDSVRAVVRAVVGSGRLGLLEVAELNPSFDVDGRTARTAARLVDLAVRA